MNKLEKYVLQYGEIPSTDSNTNKKDENNLNYRLGIAEEQVGMLGRKLIELEIENEKLKLQENKVSTGRKLMKRRFLMKLVSGSSIADSRIIFSFIAE